MKVTDKAESTIGLIYIRVAICFVSTHFSIPIYAFNRTNIYLFVGKVCQEKVYKSRRHLYRWRTNFTQVVSAPASDTPKMERTAVNLNTMPVNQH